MVRQQGSNKRPWSRLSTRIMYLVALLCFVQSSTAQAEALQLRSPSVDPVAFGVTEVGELRIIADIDNDEMDDGWENAVGTDPFTADADEDMDGDGLTNGQEFRLGTDPGDSDSDNDGVSDGVEVAAGSDANDPTDTETLVSPLVSLSVTPEAAVIIRNSVIAATPSMPLTVTATYLDGSTRDVSTDILTSIESFDPGIVSITDADANGLANGTATILVTHRGKSALATLTVESFAPIAVAAINTAGYAYDIAVSGSIAYVADGGGGLALIDVSTPSAPVTLSTLALANARGLEVVGTRVLVANGASGLAIVDVSDPLVPELLGQVAVGDTALGVASLGRYAFVAASSAGLVVVDVADALAPTLVATLDLPGAGATAVTVDAVLQRVAIADSSSRLDLVDIADPTVPQLLGGSAVGGVPTDLTTTGIYSYVSAGTGRVSIFNTSTNPPTGLSQINTAGLVANGVEAAGELLFVADWGFVNFVPIYNVVNPAVPVQVGGIDFSFAQGTYTPVRADANGTKVAVSGEFAYLTVGADGVQIGQFARYFDAGTSPPTVAITAPTPGSSFVSGQAINVTVQAIDDVSVASMQLLVDGVLVAEIETPRTASHTESFSVPAPATSTGGTVLIEARARDLAGNLGVASEVEVDLIPPNDTVPPTIALLQPEAGVEVSGGRAFIVWADASDDQGVAFVEVAINGVTVAEKHEAPYNLVAVAPVTGLAGDDIVVTVTAYDYALNTGTDQVTLVHGGPREDMVAECVAGVPAFELASSVQTGFTQGPSDFSCVGGVGDGSPEVIHLYEVTAERQLSSITFTTALPETDFNTVLQVRSGSCADPNAELACVDNVGADTRSTVTLANPPIGPLWVFVDGAAGTNGTYGLSASGSLAVGAECDTTDMAFPCPELTSCREPTPGAAPVCLGPRCSDGFDYDGDGLLDYPEDPGCISLDDPTEYDPASAPLCANGLDDDNDGDTDWSQDAECVAACGPNEEGGDCLCLADDDCASLNCNNGTCEPPTCFDMIANGDETDMDCGGGGACPKCIRDMACLVNEDCLSNDCQGGVCIPDCPGLPSPPECINIVAGRPVTVSGTYSGYSAEAAVSDATCRGWNGGAFPSGPWLRVDLGTMRPISGVSLIASVRVGGVVSYAIETSSDDTNYVTSLTGSLPPGVGTGTYIPLAEPVTARYIRFRQTSSPDWSNWNEVGAYECP